MKSSKVLTILEQQCADTLRQHGEATHWKVLLGRVDFAIDECQKLAQQLHRDARRTSGLPIPGLGTPQEREQRATDEFEAVKGLQRLRQRVLGRICEFEPRFDPSVMQ